MLTTAVSRLRALWPGASIQVITSAPAIVAAHCGDVVPVPLSGRRLVLEDRLLGRFDKLLPAVSAARWGSAEQRLRLRNTRFVKLSLRLKRSSTPQAASDAAAFLSAIDHADLCVVSGAGVLTDAFPDNALGVLATLQMAIHRGIPTAMFGQGIGPILNTELRSRAAEVLPHVGLIAVRERLSSIPLLASLGVSPDRIVLTGDDAIEMAMRVGATDSGVARETTQRVGVNLRVASYAEVSPEHLRILREALRSTSRAYSAEFVPVPIAHRAQMDAGTLRELLADMPGENVDGGASLDTPQLVLHRIRQCRVVVSGSYHAAVFALAQGIPAVALASSQYYLDKMRGLRDQFGEGCSVVPLEPASQLASRFTSALNGAWESADRLRPTLLARAAAQVASGHAAYARLATMIP